MFQTESACNLLFTSNVQFCRENMDLCVGFLFCDSGKDVILEVVAKPDNIN